eukprot:gnl/MRDRNA2_/MRDRNA2_83127_c0_seq5.p1 gnl/MRDRNA2_/MRDRNA2_83127_c0~~gnl/MRDRNA2_/MRDRNA2_83127_c0_seq5.p1  ORF type:complete len:381 (+),score=45.87 gnl/MRDRNA2_/MRDRNA2_83127_c0_seq5:147-1289(+)
MMCQKLSRSQACRLRRKNAMYRRGKIDGQSLCLPPGNFVDCTDDESTDVETPPEPVHQDHFVLDSTLLRSSLLDFLTYSADASTWIGQSHETARNTGEIAPFPTHPVGSEGVELDAMMGSHMCPVGSEGVDQAVQADLTKCVATASQTDSSSCNPCDQAAEVPIPDSDDNEDDGSMYTEGSSVILYVEALTSRIVGVTVGQQLSKPKRKIVRAVRSQQIATHCHLALSNPCESLEQLFVDTCISGLLASCRSLELMVESFSANLVRIKRSSWREYLDCHLMHLVYPAQRLIEVRRRIRVGKPSTQDASRLFRIWHGRYDARPLPRSIPASTMVDLQVLCAEVDDYAEQLDANPFVVEHIETAIAMVFQHVEDCHDQQRIA